LIAKEDSTRLMEFRQSIDHSFARILPRLPVYNQVQETGTLPKNLTDRQPGTSWARTEIKLYVRITLQFEKNNHNSIEIVLQEDIALGSASNLFPWRL